MLQDKNTLSDNEKEQIINLIREGKKLTFGFSAQKTIKIQKAIDGIYGEVEKETVEFGDR